MRTTMLRGGKISEEDLALMTITDSPAEAASIIVESYQESYRRAQEEYERSGGNGSEHPPRPLLPPRPSEPSAAELP